MISISAAIQQIVACRTSWGTTIVPLDDVSGRVLAEPLPIEGVEGMLTEGIRLDFRHLVPIATAGVQHIKVFNPPRVSVIASPAYSPLFSSVLGQYGIQPEYFKDLHGKNLEEALTTDLLIISGEDAVHKRLMAAGVEQVFHKVKAKPLKTVWFGYSPTRTRVLVLPENGFSVQVGAKLLLESYLRACWHMPALKPWFLPFLESRPAVQSLDDFVPACMVHKNGLRIKGMHVTPGKEALAAANADGVICHAPDAGSLEPGSLVPFYPWSG
ncbi:hypothetical protein ACWKWU_00530 [Chitinophaga lutea]